MQLKLKEDPREWSKFAAILMLFLAAMAALLWRRRAISNPQFAWTIAVAIAGAANAVAFPRLWRPIYRGVMTVSFYWGQFMGRVLLSLFFLLLLTPIALLIRLLGKDLLRLKRNPAVQTYWQPAKPNDDFDRQF